MNYSKFQFLLLGTVFAFSCTQNPKSDEAEVGAAQEVTAAAETATTLSINNEASEVTWVGTKPTGRHDGRFPIKQGSISVENSEIVGGTIVMDLSNIEVTDAEISDEDRGKLTGHLKSNDFFNVESFPEAKFEITSVKPYAAGTAANENADAEADSEFKLANPTHTVTGNLTIRDTTNSISFPAIISISDNEVTARAKFNIDRTDWNVSYGDEDAVADKARDQFIYNKVNLGLDIQASK